MGFCGKQLDFVEIAYTVLPVDAWEQVLPEALYAGPALSRCNRCSCIGPRASGAPR